MLDNGGVEHDDVGVGVEGEQYLNSLGGNAIINSGKPGSVQRRLVPSANVKPLTSNKSRYEFSKSNDVSVVSARNLATFRSSLSYTLISSVQDVAIVSLKISLLLSDALESSILRYPVEGVALVSLE